MADPTPASASRSSAGRTTDNILSRIKKLLAVANNSSATEAEVESYMGAAKRLMEEHNIDEAAVLSTDDGRQTAFDSVVDEEGLGRSQIVKHEMWMAQAVCCICDVEYYLKTSAGWTPSGRPAMRKEVRFVGLPTDVSVAKVFYAEMLTAVKILARMKIGEGWSMDHYYYCEGFTSRIQERAVALKKYSAGAGLVLCKDKIIERWMAERLNLVFTTSRGSLGASNAAYHYGRADGDKADIGVDNRLQRGAAGQLGSQTRSAT